MVARYASVVLASLLVAVVAVGCASQSATQASAPAGTGAENGSAAMGTAVVPASQTDGRGAVSPMSSRPALQDFAAVGDLSDVYFDFDRYDIRPLGAKVLEASASWLKTHPDHLVVIEGHADERGTNEYNLSLGERRAKASMNYLVSHGVQASRITVVSYGEERAVCSDKTEGCWSRNRRAHFLVKAR